MNDQTEIHVRQEVSDFGYDVWVGQKINGIRHVGSPCVFTPATPGSVVTPTFRLDPAAAQLLMEQLWQMGLRPRDGAGSLAHVDAMKDHLADLRRIAFARKEVPAQAGPTR